MNYDVSVLEKNPQYIPKFVDTYFNCDIISSCKVGEGFYGSVYLISLPKEPHKLIIKFYKHCGRNSLEYQQLNLLRKYSLLKIPQTYFVHNKSEDIPFEALAMEYIEGINASQLPTNHENKDAFADEMISNLIHLHSITNENGFGTDGAMFADWKSCFGNKIDKMHKLLHSDFSQRVSPYVMEIANKSVESFDKIFAEPVKSSLVHSDYNLWNILVDENTAKITAVIDPLDAGWADREIDLFHLENADGNRFKLLKRYQSQVKLSELFPVKNAFYWFWDDIKHLQNMGWYEEERFSSFGNRLMSLMEEYL